MDVSDYILTKKLFSPSLGRALLLSKIGSLQLTLIRSGVAGLLKLRTSSQPHSFRDAISASLMAKKTALPIKRGGSPTPRDRWIVRRFSHSTSLRSETLNSCGTSRKPGILYAPGPRVNNWLEKKCQPVSLGNESNVKTHPLARCQRLSSVVNSPWPWT